MGQSVAQVASNRGKKWGGTGLKYKCKLQMKPCESQRKQEKLMPVMARLSRAKDKEDTVPFQSPKPIAFKGATT